MRRDLELTRKLLLDIEKHYKGSPIQLGLEPDDKYSDREIQYHIGLLGVSKL